MYPDLEGGKMESEYVGRGPGRMDLEDYQPDWELEHVRGRR